MQLGRGETEYEAHMEAALVIGGVAVIVALNLVARRTGLPAAALLVIAGLVYAALPGPNVTLSPHLLLQLVIPPLLYAAALNSSALALRRNRRTIASLSIGLVVATAVVVGVALHAAAGAVTLSAAVALGAAVAPSDPVASLAIGRRVGLPGRLVSIVEGEGLLNDATALTLFGVMTTAATGGDSSALQGVGRFMLATSGGIVTGLVVAAVLGQLRRWINDPLSENAVSLVTPFIAYRVAESFGGSGVLAVVVAGLYYAHRGPSLQTGQSRLQTRAVWSLVEYGLEGFVFLFIGQQLPTVLSGLGRYGDGVLVAAAGAVVGAVLVVRPLWLVLTERVLDRVHMSLGQVSDPDGESGHRLMRHQHLNWKEITALSWSGTRGVITLAAAFSIPRVANSGQPIAGRNLLLFCAYLVVLTTLLGQGLTFAPLLHWLGLDDPRAAAVLLRNEARVAAVEAAMERLEELVDAGDVEKEVAENLRNSAKTRLDRYRDRIDRISGSDGARLPADDPYFSAVRARRAMIDAERDELLHWRDSGRLPDDQLRALLRELDHEEGLLPN
jgi:Na+/H+ antiporter